MFAAEVHPQEKPRFHLSEHPWISLVALWVVGLLVLILAAIAANQVGVPEDAPYRPLITPTLAHILVLFIIAPIVLRLPNGKTTFRKYLDDVRLSRIRPLIPLLVLSVNTFVFRLAQGLPLNVAFLRRVINQRSNLPPQSLSYIISFPAIFEEVSWRGVMLVLFMKKYPVKKSLQITAFGFGIFHIINLMGGVEPDFVIRQVIFGSFVGLFYGYLVLRSDSLIPAMLFHYLVNMFIGSFTIYFQRYAPAGTQILYSLINLPLAATILILWVKYFYNNWIPRPVGLQPITLWRKQK